MTIKPLTDNDFDLFSARIKEELLYSKTRIYFGVGFVDRMGRYFPSGTQEDLFLSFFSCGEDTAYSGAFAGSWDGRGGIDIAIEKLSLLVRAVVEEYKESFTHDKVLSSLALSHLALEYIGGVKDKAKKGYFSYKHDDTEDSIPLNILHVLPPDEDRDEEFWLEGNTSFMFSREHLKQFEKRNARQLFLKDILSVVTSYIRANLDKKIENMQVKGFFDTKEEKIAKDTLAMMFEIKEVFEKQEYFRKRKVQKTTRLTRKNFKAVFISYVEKHMFKANENLDRRGLVDEMGFFAYLKKNRIQNDIFKPVLLSGKGEEYEDVFDVVIKQCKQYVSHTLPDRRDLEDNDLFYSKRYESPFVVEHNSLDGFRESMQRYIKHDSAYSSFSSKQLNPKRYAHKTKMMIKEHFVDIVAVDRHTLVREGGHYGDSRAEGYFANMVSMVDGMKGIGVSEKTIRAFLLPYIDLKSFVYIIGTTLCCDMRLQHDAYDAVLPFAKKMLLHLGRDGFNNPHLANTLFKLLARYNMDNESLDRVSRILASVTINSALLSEHKSLVIHKISDLNNFFAETEHKIRENLMAPAVKAINIALDDTAFKMAKQMDAYLPFSELLMGVAKAPAILSGFKKDSLAVGNEIKREKYSVSVRDHNDSIGLLGADVKGVCISSSGKERMSQINPYFSNLCISDNEKMLLWGLLCRAVGKDGEVYYILNNLQGTINNKGINSKEVMVDIISVLSVFKKENGLKELLFRNNGFNSLRLEGGHIEDEDVQNRKIMLKKKVRLDFYLEGKQVLGDFNTVLDVSV